DGWHRDRDAEAAENPSLGARASSVLCVSDAPHAGCVRSQEAMPPISAIMAGGLRSSAAFSNIFELVLGHAEVMTELVPERKSDLLANFVIGGANGFDVFLVEQDMIRTRRHIPTTPCRLRDPDKFAHQQDFIRILAEQAARVLLSTRHVLHHYCHILNPPSEFFRQ